MLPSHLKDVNIHRQQLKVYREYLALCASLLVGG